MTNRFMGIEESWNVAGHCYEIVESVGGYSIRVTKPDGSYVFVREPESTFETPSGARYAILMDMEQRLVVSNVRPLHRVK